MQKESYLKLATNKSDCSKYKSPSTGEYCTAAQYISELMCQRMAENNNEGSLAYKFWNTKKWKRTYINQVTKANKLVEKYDERAIVKFLNSDRGKRIYSLRFPNLEDMIAEEERKLETLDESSNTADYKDSSRSQPRKPFGKQSDMSRLRNLDE